MLKKWLKYICDPIDKTNLEFLEITKNKGNDVISGTLKSKSGHMYKIRNGVPILINNFTQSTSSVESFAYEWNTFDFDYGKNGWIQDIVKPVVGTTRYFKNKIIVDCGAGSGRQSLWMAEAGAKFVFSIELSDSATSIVKKVTNKFKDKVFVIQADIAHIPIKINIKPDLIYCVNVIQHTENPLKTTIEMAKLLDISSDFLFNIYMEKGRKLFLTLLSFIRKFTKHIPHVFIKFISFLITITCFILLYIPIISSWIKKSLPVKSSFKETWLDIYDILGSHKYQKFYSDAELGQILKKARLKIIKRSKYAMLLKMI